ncbi:MAG: DUF2156 domain-containing protein [Candidatus Viridilinea halotolerans]|uniref:DUF2156 domain-containing protein n=1 Tax=Candidatus Viridilinea halotolerans TaxID=2491704 RepID=A0A426U225_9CHLR|nr:MAG: DUF2156 domain-containing protein [Candidatus Viridilinea halotolerans]
MRLTSLCTPHQKCAWTDAPPPRDPEAARGLVLRYGWHTVAYQILNPGIAHWLPPDRSGVVGYVASAGMWLAAGAPLGPPDRLADLAAAFAATAARHGQRVAYFAAQAEFADRLAHHGPLARLPLGVQPVWNPQAWPALVAHKASLRAQLARARNKGLTVERWSASFAARQPSLQACLAQWLAQRALPPMHFLVEPHALAAPADRIVFVALRDKQPVAYLLATPIPQRQGWLFEQLVRGKHAPNGGAELLIDAAMREVALQGATYATLGLVPLAQHPLLAAELAAQPIHIRLLLDHLRSYGQAFYNFTGLQQFRTRLQPAAWEPVYLLSHERQTSLATLYAVAEAFAGVPLPLFLLQAVLRQICTF